MTGDLAAGNNISLNTQQGQFSLNGGNLTAASDIHLSGDYVRLNNTTLNSTQGNITVEGMNGGDSHAGVVLSGNVSMLASHGNVTVNASASSYGHFSSDYDIGYTNRGNFGGLNLNKGNFTFNAVSTDINATGAYKDRISPQTPAAGILFNSDANIDFTGNATINADASNAYGIFYENLSFGSTEYNLSAHSGNVVINASGVMEEFSLVESMYYITLC